MAFSRIEESEREEEADAMQQLEKNRATRWSPKIFPPHSSERERGSLFVSLLRIGQLSGISGKVP
jgi:hypothetical protein